MISFMLGGFLCIPSCKKKFDIEKNFDIEIWFYKKFWKNLTLKKFWHWNLNSYVWYFSVFMLKFLL